MREYPKTYEIRWSDLHANSHVNYAAYIDAAGDLRYRFFTEHEFPPGGFVQLGVGPVPRSLRDVFGSACRYIAPHQPINLSDSDKAIAVLSRDDPNEPESMVLYEQEVK